MEYRDRDWLYDQHITQGKSHKSIAKEFGYGLNTIKRWINKHGIVNPIPYALRKKGHHPPVLISCEECGKQRLEKHAKLKDGHGRFCGESCAAKSRYRNGGGEKLMKGHIEFFSTDEGKEMRSKNGVKAALKFADRDIRTSIEIKVAEELEARGIKFVEQYNLGDKFLIDFYLPEYNIAIEADGDYWHRLPKSIGRDKAKNAYVKACGISLYRFWESEINEDVEACIDIVFAEINSKPA